MFLMCDRLKHDIVIKANLKFETKNDKRIICKQYVIGLYRNMPKGHDAQSATTVRLYYNIYAKQRNDVHSQIPKQVLFQTEYLYKIK